MTNDKIPYAFQDLFDKINERYENVDKNLNTLNKEIKDTIKEVKKANNKIATTSIPNKTSPSKGIKKFNTVDYKKVLSGEYALQEGDITFVPTELDTGLSFNTTTQKLEHRHDYVARGLSPQESATLKKIVDHTTSASQISERFFPYTGPQKEGSGEVGTGFHALIEAAKNKIKINATNKDGTKTPISIIDPKTGKVTQDSLVKYVKLLSKATYDASGNKLSQAENQFDLADVTKIIDNYQNAINEKNEEIIKKEGDKLKLLVEGLNGELTKPYQSGKKPVNIQREAPVSLLVKVGGQTLLINGTADEIQTFKDKTVRVLDSKTTKTIEPKGRLQTSVYTLGLRAQGKNTSSFSQIVHTPNYNNNVDTTHPVEVLNVDNYSDQTLYSILTDYVGSLNENLTDTERISLIKNAQQQILFGDDVTSAVYSKNQKGWNLINGLPLNQLISSLQTKYNLTDEETAKYIDKILSSVQIDDSAEGETSDSIKQHFQNLLNLRREGGDFVYKGSVQDLLRKKYSPDIYGVSDQPINKMVAYYDPALTKIMSPYSLGGMTPREWTNLMTSVTSKDKRDNFFEQLDEVFNLSFQQDPNLTVSQNRNNISALRGWVLGLNNVIEEESKNVENFDFSAITDEYKKFINDKKTQYNIDQSKTLVKKPFKLKDNEKFEPWVRKNFPQLYDKYLSRKKLNTAKIIEKKLSSLSAYKDIISALNGDEYINYIGRPDINKYSTMNDDQVQEQVKEELVDDAMNKKIKEAEKRKNRLHTIPEEPTDVDYQKITNRILNWFTNSDVYLKALDRMSRDYIKEHPEMGNIDLETFADLALTEKQKKQFENAKGAIALYDKFFKSKGEDIFEFIAKETHNNPDASLTYTDKNGKIRNAPVTDEQSNIVNYVLSALDKGINGKHKFLVKTRNNKPIYDTITGFIRKGMEGRKVGYRINDKKQFLNVLAGLPLSTLGYFFTNLLEPITRGSRINKQERQLFDTSQPITIEDMVKFFNSQYATDEELDSISTKTNIPALAHQLKGTEKFENLRQILQEEYYKWYSKQEEKDLDGTRDKSITKFLKYASFKKFLKKHPELSRYLDVINSVGQFITEKNDEYLDEAKSNEKATIEAHIQKVREKEVDTKNPINTINTVTPTQSVNKDSIFPQIESNNDFVPINWDKNTDLAGEFSYWQNSSIIPPVTQPPIKVDQKVSPTTGSGTVVPPGTSAGQPGGSNGGSNIINNKNTYTGEIKINSVDRMNITAKVPGAVDIQKTGKFEAQNFTANNIQQLTQNYNSVNNTVPTTPKKKDKVDNTEKRKSEELKLKKKREEAAEELRSSLLTEERLKNDIAKRNLQKNNASPEMKAQLEAENAQSLFELERLKKERQENNWEGIINNPEKVKELYQEASLQADSYAAAQARLNKEMNPTVWDSMKKSFQGWLRSLTGGTLIWTFAAQARRSINNIVQGAQKLDAVLTDLRIVTGDTREETKSLMTSYSKLGNELSASTSEVASAANSWLRQGYAISEVNDLISASMHLSKLGMIDSGKATEYLTEILD